MCANVLSNRYIKNMQTFEKNTFCGIRLATSTAKHQLQIRKYYYFLGGAFLPAINGHELIEGGYNVSNKSTLKQKYIWGDRTVSGDAGGGGLQSISGCVLQVGTIYSENGRKRYEWQNTFLHPNCFWNIIFSIRRLLGRGKTVPHKQWEVDRYLYFINFVGFV